MKTLQLNKRFRAKDFGFGSVFLFLAALPASADDELCASLERIVSERSVHAMKANLVGFDRWSTDFKVEGFNRCIVSALPEDADPTMISTDAVECEVWMDGLEQARNLRDVSLKTLSCNSESIQFPSLSTEGRELFLPASGLALSADVQSRSFDFSLWRDALVDGDERITPYEFKVTIMIFGLFSKP